MKSKNNPRNYDCHEGCPVEAALDIIGNRWKGVILYMLLSGTKRFSEIKNMIPNITQRVLTLQLRELESDAVIHRKVYPEIPPKVEYSLTEAGQQLEPILRGLREWGANMLKK